MIFLSLKFNPFFQYSLLLLMSDDLLVMMRMMDDLKNQLSRRWQSSLAPQRSLKNSKRIRRFMLKDEEASERAQ